jgi:hypothetical protein
MKKKYIFTLVKEKVLYKKYGVQNYYKLPSVTSQFIGIYKVNHDNPDQLFVPNLQSLHT